MGPYEKGSKFGGLLATDLGNMDGDWDVDDVDVVKIRSSNMMVQWLSNKTAQANAQANAVEAAEDSDASTPRPLDFRMDDPSPRKPEPPATMSSFPHPELTNIPAPTLTYDFRMCAVINPRINIGSGPLGDRKWTSFRGGSWSASFGSGTVIPGGRGIKTVSPDLQIRIEANCLLQTDDEPPACIEARTTGWRTASKGVLESLLDPAKADSIPMTAYKFRLFVELETGDQRYKDKINCGMWVGSGVKRGEEFIYDVYRVG